MHLVVKSSDRDTSDFYNSPSQFRIVFSRILHNIRRVKLTNVIFPNVIYNVTNLNNVFSFTVGSSSFTYYIPQGFYTINNLLNTLQTGLNAIGQAQPNPFNFTLSFNYNSQLVTITCSTSCKLNFNATNSCAKLLGFPFATTSSNTSFTSIYAPSLLSPINLFLNIQELGYSIKVLNNEYTFYIPLINQNSTLLFLDSNQLGDQEIRYFYPQNISTLTITLTDENGNLVNTLNLDWSFVLYLECDNYDYC